MHIMEGFLPAEWCAVWFIISIPIVLYGVYQIKKITETTPESKALIAVSGAFMFILSSLKLPSVTGSCSHPTGNGFGAVLFGPAVTAVLASIVLISSASIQTPVSNAIPSTPSLSGAGTNTLQYPEIIVPSSL